jgi:hypothetical protein
METHTIELSAQSVSNCCGQRRSESDLDSDVMSIGAFMQQLHALNSSLETLAAIGAELRLRLDGLTGDARVRSLLQEVVYRIDPTVLDGMNWKKANLASAFFETNNVSFGSSLRHKNHDAAGSHQVGISRNYHLCTRVRNVARRQERSVERAVPTSSGNRW